MKVFEEYNIPDYYRTYTRVFGKSRPYDARYYPQGYNLVRAVFSSHPKRMWRYVIALRYLNPEASADELYSYIGKVAMDRRATIDFRSLDTTITNAMRLKRDEMDVVETRKLRFLGYSQFLKKAQKTIWSNEIRASLYKEEINAYLEEYPNATTKKIAEDLHISAPTVRKYRNK